MSNRPPSLPNACLNKGCLKLTGMLAGGFALILVFAFCSDLSNNRKQEARMGTLEGKASVLAERKFGKTAAVTLDPQADGGQRVKIEFDGPFSVGKARGRENVFFNVKGFLANFYERGGAGEVSSFWFSPQSDLVDQYGKESRGAVGKLVIDRAVTDKVASWENMTPERAEALFQEEGTVWWHPAVRD